MDMYKDILSAALAERGAEVSFKNLTEESPLQIVERACFQAVSEIRAILDNATLSDFECVEQITRLLERLGTDGGGRHDFG